jgi:hypothetical protein|nr:MAG TPA: hypothetical protein [Crassvirales sp.]
MKEVLRFIIIFFLIGLVIWAAALAIRTLEEEKKTETSLLWQVDESKKYTDFEPGLITFLKDTPTHKVLYAIDANEEAESYFGLYLVTDSAGTVSSKLLFMARSVEQLQGAAESLQATSVQGGDLKPSQGRK